MNRANLAFCLILAGAACLIAVGSAAGQYAPGMDGRANDASNQVGSGGYNTPVQSSFINSANLYVTGNVSRGAFFRGYSPVRNANELFLSMPSARFGDYQRDAVSVNDVTGGTVPWQTNPYFNPYRTVTNVSGIQAGVNQPGSPVPSSTYQLPGGTLATPYGTSFTTPLNTAYGTQSLPGVLPNSSLYTPENSPQLGSISLEDRLRLTGQSELLRQSPVFGRTEIRTQPLTPQQAQDTRLRDPYSRSDELLRLRRTAPIERRSRTVADSVPTSEQMLRGSRDLLSPTQLAPKLIADSDPTRDGQRDLLTGRPLPEESPYAAVRHAEQTASPTALQRPTSLSPSATNRYFGENRVFTADTPTSSPLIDLAEAVVWLEEYQGTPDANQRLAELPNVNRQYSEAVATVRSAAESPVKTLAGDSDARIDRTLRDAEQKLHEGEYYRAADLYELAARRDPDNPLIRLGQAHALLAAGEYMTALLHLERAIEAYPAFGYLRLDLQAFIPDLEALDVRRADLERRLEREEDYRLRFLLGYMEYYSGLEKFGLPNLQEAAEAAPAGSVIARFPQMLEDARNAIPPQPAEESSPISGNP